MLVLDKNNIRDKYLNIRRNICKKKEKSLIIMHKLIELNEYKNANIIALYKSLESEVYTDCLFKKAMSDGKIVVFPKVIDNNLLFYKVSFKQKYRKSNLGVDEPICLDEDLVLADNIDLVIVPGVCFDIHRNRLGFGGGYYDRFLKTGNFDIIGLSYYEQLLLDCSIPTEYFDIKMDKIITDVCIID